jgi:hypothetical protein
MIYKDYEVSARAPNSQLFKKENNCFLQSTFLGVEMTSYLHETETYCFILVYYALVLMYTGVSL